LKPINIKMKRAFDEISDDEWGDATVKLDRAIKRPVHEYHISNGNGLIKEVKVLPPLESFAFKSKSKGVIATPQRLDHPLEDDDFQVTKCRPIGSRGRRFVVDKSDEEFETIIEKERNVLAPPSDENESLGTGLQNAKVVDVEGLVEIDSNLEELYWLMRWDLVRQYRLSYFYLYLNIWTKIQVPIWLFVQLLF